MKRLVCVMILMLGLILSGSSSWATFQEGGDRLVDTQYTDGGWGWPLNSPPTYGNILGPIAMGLAHAYEQTGDPDHLAALGLAGTYFLSKTNNFSPSDGYLAVKLDSIFGGNTYTSHVVTNFYAQLAVGTYNRNGLGILYDTSSYVSLIRTNRSGSQANLAAWDIGMGLYAANLAGADISAWLSGLKAEIDELDGDKYYDVVGLAGALFGLASVGEDYDPIAGEHAAASNLGDLADILASYQIAGGGFAWNSNYVIPNDGNETVQETAYAILALKAADAAGYWGEIYGARTYLEDVQMGTGGWENYPGYGENNEITGEALWAVSESVPEPTTMALLTAGIAAMAGRRRGII